MQAEIAEDGGRASTATLDIRIEDDVKRVIGELLAAHGPIQGLVNNAGGQFPAPLVAINQKGWETVVRTNLTGGFLMSRELFLQGMRSSCLLYTSPSPRDLSTSRMPSSA